jgi:4-hydroxybenzoate polyprenyltransferase
MTHLLILMELVLIVLVLYVSRQWEMGLFQGKDPPRGRGALYLRIMRPQHWILFTTLFVFVASPGFRPELALVLPAVFFQQAFLFGANDYWDREVDSINPLKKKRNVVASGELSLSECRGVLFLIFGLGLFFSALLGWAAAGLAALFLAVSYAYTAPPFRLKGRIVWDLVSHGFVVFSFPFLFTTVALGLYSGRNLVMYLLFIFLSLQIQLSQEARDFQDDAEVEVNSVLAMGYQKTYLFMAMLLAAGFVLCFLLVFSGRASALFLLVAVLCASALDDLYRTWKSRQVARAFQNIWSGFNKKALVGSLPVVLWWLLH